MYETIGMRLRKARQHHEFTLEEAAEATRIRINYLKALESDDYSIMPSAAQGRGFLRNYADFLELDLDAELAEIQKHPPEPSEISGPLSNADILSEQPAPVAETPARPSLLDQLRSVQGRFLPRSSNGEPAPESEALDILSDTDVHVQVEIVETPKRRERKKRAEKPAEEQVQKKGRTSKKEPPPTMEVGSAQDVGEVKPERENLLIDEEQIRDETLSRLPIEDRITDPEPGIRGETESPQVAVQPVEESKPNLLQKFSRLFKHRSAKNGTAPTQNDVPQLEVKELEQQVVPTSAPVANETAEEIFMSIGRLLQVQRELISLTFDEVERHTYVRALFLKQMEEGAFDKLPSPVQTRGMLANYATFLDLDADTILLRYAEAIQARHRQKYPERLRSKSPIEPKPSIPPLRSFIAGDVIFGVTMVVILIALAIWGVGRVLATQSSEQAALPTAPSISDVLAGTSVPTVLQEVTFVPVDDAPLLITQEPTLEVPTLPANISVQVILTAVERAFVRVTVDGEIVYDGRVAPGDEFTFDAETQISILTGNAAALRVIYNGRDLGLMGSFGEVVSQIYTGAGLATPTATLPPTATPTPLVSPTPTQTGTATPTATATPALSTPTP